MKNSISETTRYLCVAARTDERFAERVVADLTAGDLRAVAPSVGFDLRPVLLHCLAARRQRYVRDVGVLAAAVLALVLAPLWTILSLILVAVMSAWLERGAGRFERPRTAALVFSVAAISLIPILLALFITALDSPGPESEDEGLPGWLIGLPWVAVAIALVMYGLVVWDLLTTRQILIRELTRTRFQPHSAPAPRAEWLAPLLSTIDNAQQGNVTVYGDFTPFIGHGTQIEGWSFAVPTLRRENPDDAVSVNVLELIEYVRNRLRAIELEELTLTDRVFVSGEALDTRFLPRRDLPPRQNLTPEEIAEIAEQPSGTARHYLCAQVASWGGDVVTSTFLHFSAKGRLLYLQCDRAILEPVWHQYHDVDRLTETPTAGQIGRLFARGASILVRTVLRAPSRVIDADPTGWRHRRRQNWTRAVAQEDLGYNYGARFSARQLAVDTKYHNYFQKADAGKHLKIVERHVLAAVLDFLDSHEVDTTEFASRQTTILNQGIIQTGGVSNVGNQAVGVQATATQKVATPERPETQEAASNA